MALHSTRLQDFLTQELLKLNVGTEITKQDRYCLHKVCFENLIDWHSTYKDLLSRIKAEYEDCIEAIERGQREATYLSGKLAANVMEPETIRNFKQRGNELELKIGLLELINDRMSSKQPRASYLNSVKSVSAGVLPSWSHSRNWSRSSFLPSLSVEQLTDTAFLTKKLADFQSRVAQLKVENETRFVPKALKGQLLNRLQEKDVIKEALLEKREDLKMKIMSMKLSLAVRSEAVQREEKSQRSRGGFTDIVKAFKQTKETMEKADEMCQEAVVEQGSDGHSSSTMRVVGDDDDPTKDRQAEFILEYIENFFELFEAGKVEEAALIAAFCPKGALRTMETLEKFKNYDATHSGSSVFVAYWEALLPTVATGCKKPSEWETVECVKCVLENGRTDLLTHWIAQGQLTLSEEVGRLILAACRCLDKCSCGVISLAEAVFESVGAYEEVLQCFLRQGRYRTAAEYSKNNSTLTQTDLLEAFQKVPLTDSVQSFLCDISTTENPIFSAREAEELLSRVLAGHACRLAAVRINRERNSPRQA